MFFYIAVYLICLCIAFVADKKKNRTLALLISLILVFLTGLRGSEVGIDTENYIGIWENIYYDEVLFVEPGFVLLNKFLQGITNNPVALFLVCSFIIYPLIIIRLWDFREIASFPVMISVFYMSHLMMSMNIIRQYCAVALIFYFTRYLSKGDYIKYIIGVLIAFTVHMSSLIGISMFAFEISKWKYLQKGQKIFLGIGIAISPVVLYYISQFAINEYGHYFNNEQDLGFLTLGKLLFVCFTYALVLRLKHIDIQIDNQSLDVFVRNTIIILIVELCIVSLGYIFPFMDRIGLLFSLYEIIFWGILFKLSNTCNRPFYLMAFILLVVYPFISDIFNNGQGTVPYYFCF